jgi:hypothetical protein
MTQTRILIGSLVAILFLTGCKDTSIIVEDNGPDKYERDQAMQDCVGQYFVKKASDELRIACTQAIYGGNQ